jgi:hypothetical protein
MTHSPAITDVLERALGGFPLSASREPELQVPSCSMKPQETADAADEPLHGYDVLPRWRLNSLRRSRICGVEYVIPTRVSNPISRTTDWTEWVGRGWLLQIVLAGIHNVLLGSRKRA